jgi:hypothetical protein
MIPNNIQTPSIDMICEALLSLRVREPPASETLAHGINDIVESAIKVAHEYLPQITSDVAPDETRKEAFFNIIEELREIAYHIDDIRRSGETI